MRSVKAGSRHPNVLVPGLSKEPLQLPAAPHDDPVRTDVRSAPDGVPALQRPRKMPDSPNTDLRIRKRRVAVVGKAEGLRAKSRDSVGFADRGLGVAYMLQYVHGCHDLEDSVGKRQMLCVRARQLCANAQFPQPQLRDHQPASGNRRAPPQASHRMSNPRRAERRQKLNDAGQACRADKALRSRCQQACDPSNVWLGLGGHQAPRRSSNPEARRRYGPAPTQPTTSPSYDLPRGQCRDPGSPGSRGFHIRGGSFGCSGDKSIGRWKTTAHPYIADKRSSFRSNEEHQLSALKTQLCTMGHDVPETRDKIINQ